MVVDCLNFVGRCFLYEVVYVNNYDIFKLLVVFGMNVDVQCDSRLLLLSMEFFILVKFV